MIYRQLLCLFIIVINTYAVNFYPIPNSITNQFRVAPTFGVIHFNDLSLTEDGGEINSLTEVWGLRLNWGEPFQGISFQYQYSNGIKTSGTATGFKETDLKINMFKCRYTYQVINDDIGMIAVFSSIGFLTGEYRVIESSESAGVTGYIVRQINATVADIGVTFGYEFNPSWHLILESAFQFSFNEEVTNLAGTSLDRPEVAFSGTTVQIGSIVQF
jgi:hypothetical protein